MKPKLILITMLLVFAVSCEPKPDSLTLLDQLVVDTNFETDDFSQYLTYAIPTDTVWFYSNASYDTLLVQDVNSPFPQPVIDSIKYQMNARHFVLKKRNENPDLGINVSVIQDYSVYQQVVGGYGGYGYGSGYYGYGSYYSPSYISTTTTNRGALIIEIIDLKNKTPDNKVKVIWTANLSDLFNAPDVITASVVAIRQAFKQSQYITTTQP